MYSPCVFFHGDLENHLKYRVGPKISNVTILIFNQGVPMNNIIPLGGGGGGLHGDPSGPMEYNVLYYQSNTELSSTQPRQLSLYNEIFQL